MKILALQDNRKAIDAKSIADTMVQHYDGARLVTKVNSVDHAIERAGFTPDLIVVAGGFEQFGPIPGLKDSGIPTALVCFKEYRENVREYDVEWCRTHDAIPFTWCPYHQDWTDQYGIKFNYLPFGASPNIHKEYGEERVYDISFLGHVHHEDRYKKHGATDMGANFQNVRARAIDMMRDLNSKLDLNIFVPETRTEHAIFEHTAILRGENYGRRLNQSKIWLNTTSALDVINPRFFECMGSKTLIFCNESASYRGIMEPGVHCVTFKMDLSDFEEKLIYYATHDDERQRIVDRASVLFLEKHTWAHRASELIKVTTDA